MIAGLFSLLPATLPTNRYNDNDRYYAEQYSTTKQTPEFQLGKYFMCGITGILSVSGSEQYSTSIKRMASSLAHRGPDEEVFYEDEFLSLAFRRLSIVDVEGGHQPFWNDEKTVLVVVNGEIYNHGELKSEHFPEKNFVSQSDCEIVVHLYDKFGLEFLSQLNGMFAIALWDTKTQELILARDRLGIKPMYYQKNKGVFTFGSELKSLLVYEDEPKTLNWRDLAQDGLQQKDDISTFVSGIEHVPAASYMRISKSLEIKTKRYWELETKFGVGEKKTRSDFESEYQSILEDSVKKRLMSDVPLGVFLSGGIDSSLISAIAAKHHDNLHCFTVVERATYRAGDVQDAIAVASELNLPHYPIEFDLMDIASQFSLEKLEEMVFLIESPRFDPEWLFKSELHRAAKNLVPGLKVILLGQGADEFAGGYSTYLGSKAANWEEYLATEVHRDITEYNRLKGEIPMQFEAFLEQYGEAFNEGPKTRGAYHTMMSLLQNQLQFFNLWHEDRSSSFHSIEARVPFLDHRLVELLASVPESLHADLFWDKSIVRTALRKVLPSYRRDKKKVPFFVTDEAVSINEFAYLISLKIFPEFEKKYLNDETKFSKFQFTALYQDVYSRNYAKFESAWRLINLMSLVIFTDMIEKPLDFASNLKRTSTPPRPLVKQEDWAKLEKQYATPLTNPNIVNLTNSDKINIPRGCEILNPLTESEGSTNLVLLRLGTEIRRVNIPDSHYWIVQIIDEMGRHVNDPKSVQHWCQLSKVPESEFFLILNELVEGGLIESQRAIV